MNSLKLDGALKILRMLNEDGFEAYIVGGYVRDRILGIEGKDIDITTSATVDEIERVFPFTYNKSTKFQTVCVWMNGVDYEVTTFRTDLKYFDHRHPKTKVSSSLGNDVKRRDFTINALCLDKELTVIDLIDGRLDLENKIIKAVGSPIKRFGEDALRMFRAFRFSARYDFEIEKHTYLAIKRVHALTRFVSKERIREELSKTLNEKYFSNVLPKMIDAGIYKAYPKLDKAFKVLNNNYNYVDFVTLMALSSYLAGKINDELILTKKEIKVIKEILKYVDLLRSRSLALDNLLDVDKASLKNAFTILKILKDETYDFDQILSLYEDMPIKSVKDLRINGGDIKKTLKLQDSPKIKTYLNLCLRAVLYGRCENNRTDLIDYLNSGINYEA